MIKQHSKNEDVTIFKAVSETEDALYDSQGIKYHKAFVGFPTEGQIQKFREAEKEYGNVVAISL